MRDHPFEDARIAGRVVGIELHLKKTAKEFDMPTSFSLAPTTKAALHTTTCGVVVVLLPSAFL